MLLAESFQRKDNEVMKLDWMEVAKIKELLSKKEKEEKCCNVVLWILAIVGVIAAAAGIAYAIYRYMNPDYLEAFEEEFEEEFEDDEDLFEDEA